MSARTNLDPSIRLAIAAAMAVLSGLPAFGGTLSVTNTNDSGPGSLRDAIASASPGDTIVEDPGLAGFLILKSTLVIDKDLAILGVGRPFKIRHGFTGPALLIAREATVSLTRVWIVGSAPIGDGYGILNSGGTLSLNQCQVESNIAVFGAGLYNDGGSVYISNSTTGAMELINSSVHGSFNSFDGAVVAFGGTITLKGVLLAFSAQQTTISALPNCFAAGGSIVSAGYNLADDNSCPLNQPGDMINTPSGLEPSGSLDSSGPTDTLPLPANSPAVDAIPVAACTNFAGCR